MQEAGTHDLEVLGLETVEFQMSVFDNASLEEQVSWLTYYAGDEEGMKAEFNTMVDLYKKQDIESLHDEIIDSDQFQDMAEDLL